jgi:hypothetical protein
MDADRSGGRVGCPRYDWRMFDWFVWTDKTMWMVAKLAGLAVLAFVIGWRSIGPRRIERPSSHRSRPGYTEAERSDA